MTADHGNGKASTFINLQNCFSHSEGLRDLGGERGGEPGGCTGCALLKSPVDNSLQRLGFA